MSNGLKALELNDWQDRLFKILLLVLPSFIGLLTICIIPLLVWLVQNIYMAQATAVLVREMAVELKEQRVVINELPPKEWQARIMRLEDSERANVQAHSTILVSLERISVKLGVVNDK